VRRGSSLFVSNSLPFVLAEADLTLHPRYSDYQSDLWSIVRGLGRYVKHIPTRNGPPVRLFYHGNIVIGPDLEISEQAKVSPPRWNGFAEYRSFLVGALAGLRQNATAPQRHVSYDLLSSISSGYDSPAAAALAAEIGCSKAVSFKTGTRYLHDGSEVEDSGVHIARALGLEVQEFARAAYLGANSIAPAEFAACGDSFDLQLAAFEGELVQKLFLTGFGATCSGIVGTTTRMRDSHGGCRRAATVWVSFGYGSALCIFRSPFWEQSGTRPSMRLATLPRCGLGCWIMTTTARFHGGSLSKKQCRDCSSARARKALLPQ